MTSKILGFISIALSLMGVFFISLIVLLFLIPNIDHIKHSHKTLCTVLDSSYSCWTEGRIQICSMLVTYKQNGNITIYAKTSPCSIRQECFTNKVNQIMYLLLNFQTGDSIPCWTKPNSTVVPPELDYVYLQEPTSLENFVLWACLLVGSNSVLVMFPCLVLFGFVLSKLTVRIGVEKNIGRQFSLRK